MIVPAVLTGLLEDAAAGHGELGPVVAAHRARQHGPHASLLGPLRLPDHRLAELGRLVGAAPMPVTAVNTTGAGGLVSLASRSVPGVQVVAVESALRDLDDLAGNAARVVAAAAELGSVEVYVEIPYLRGWERAVDVVEAGGLFAVVRVGAGEALLELAAQVSMLIEADVPFKTTGADCSPVGLAAAVEALVDGAQVADAAQLLSDERGTGDLVGVPDDAAAARVRRRLRLVACSSVADTLAGLVRAGAISRA